jgi:hypothetical protein
MLLDKLTWLPSVIAFVYVSKMKAEGFTPSALLMPGCLARLRIPLEIRTAVVSSIAKAKHRAIVFHDPVAAV